MSFQISPAFAQAEIEYRQQRIKAEFPARKGPVRRVRLTALFKPRRRPQPAPRQPLSSPHHMASS